MTGLSNKTLAQIVMEDHRNAFVFEKYHLDFCCKGKRSLEQACAEQHINATDVINELSHTVSTGTGTCALEFPFDKMSLTQLADYIVTTHHAYVKKEAKQILAWLEKVAFKHAGRYPELKRILALFTSEKEEMDLHMEKEELILFPRIKELERISKEANGKMTININYLLSPIAILEKEHDYAGSLLEEIRNLSNDYVPPEEACTTNRLAFAALRSFEADLHQHVHLENNILFPKAITMLRSVRVPILN